MALSGKRSTANSRERPRSVYRSRPSKCPAPDLPYPRRLRIYGRFASDGPLLLLVTRYRLVLLDRAGLDVHLIYRRKVPAFLLRSHARMGRRSRQFVLHRHHRGPIQHAARASSVACSKRRHSLHRSRATHVKCLFITCGNAACYTLACHAVNSGPPTNRSALFPL